MIATVGVLERICSGTVTVAILDHTAVLGHKSTSDLTGTESQTAIFYDYGETYCCSDNIKYSPDLKENIRLKNTAKATAVMVQLGREYVSPVYQTLMVKMVFKVLRLLFPCSGKLPKRIRRIRKSK